VAITALEFDECFFYSRKDEAVVPLLLAQSNGVCKTTTNVVTSFKINWVLIDEDIYARYEGHAPHPAGVVPALNICYSMAETTLFLPIWERLNNVCFL
jgi:hypothetical protein